MRLFLTSLLAFIVAGLAGGMVAQILAEWTRAGEEYILVFAWTFLFGLVVTVVFFIAQFFANASRAIHIAGSALIVLLGAFTIVLAAWPMYEAGGFNLSDGDYRIIAGLILPSLILVHWWIVRWRVGKTPAGFGRGEAAP